MILRKITSYILIILLSFYGGLGNFMVYALSPSDINSKVFFIDGQDIDNDGNSSNEPLNNSIITHLIDKFGTNTGSQLELNKKPTYQTNSINSYPSIYFDGSNDLLNLTDNLDISTGTGYSEKSYAMIIKTGNDISTFQTIYDEGIKQKGFSFQIENSNLYGGAFNSLDWTVGEEYKTIDFGTIEINTIYTIIFVFDQTNNFIKGYLNGELINTLTNIEIQKNHGACSLDSTSFDCALYSTGGALGIGSTKNDILKLSDNSESKVFEGDFFKGNIGEISSYNHALTELEVIGLNDYLFTKWGLDNIAPIITSTNFASGTLLPGGNHNMKFEYNDSHTGSLGINTASGNIELYKWNGTSWGTDISAIGIGISNITSTGASYPINNLNYGKYKTIFNISDNFGNISENKEIIFYIDTPQLIVSTGSINIGELKSSSNILSEEITILVRTVGAGFKVKLKKNSKLNYNGILIPYHDGTTGLGFDKNKDGNIHDFNNDIIGQEIKNININGDLNNYVYKIKVGAMIEELQAGGDYSGKIDFGIELDY